MVSGKDKKDDMIRYRCPRWEELPDIGLYMDQVVNVVERYTAVFHEKDTKVITPMMINNYVKQKKMRPPQNKKYDRGQIAYLIIVTILKRFMSFGEINDGIHKVHMRYSYQEAYNLFCEYFEHNIRNIFLKNCEGFQAEAPLDYGEAILKDDNDDLEIIYVLTNAYAHMLYASYIIAKNKLADPENKINPEESNYGEDTDGQPGKKRRNKTKVKKGGKD